MSDKKLSKEEIKKLLKEKFKGKGDVKIIVK